MSGTRVRVHGLVIDSPVEVAGCDPADPSAAVDLTVVVSDRFGAEGTPEGEPILVDHEPDGPRVFVRQADGSALLRLHGLADVHISTGLDTAEIRLRDGADPAIVPVLVPGLVASAVLRLRGALVLHASSVAFTAPSGSAWSVAFAGRRGWGKSTLATACCDAGGRLLSDDVSVVDLATSPPTVRPGTRTLRLRRTTDELGIGGAFEGRGQTVDGRTTAAPEPSPDAPLGVVAIPQPDRDLTDPVVQRLHPVDALAWLRLADHLGEAVDPVMATADLDRAITLVGAVPVVVLRMPWSLPFAPGLPERVVEVLREVAEVAAG